ncbi:MAG: aminotransferase class III-fold pyridoxal phosphate-dependent enzyme, partial [Roseiflexaceae bacterium]
GLAACSAVLDILHSPTFQQHLANISALFASGVSTLATHPRVHHTRHIGMMAAIDLAPNDAIRWEDGVRHGLHLAVKANTIVLAPPLTSTPHECNDIMQRLTALLDEGGSNE